MKPSRFLCRCLPWFVTSLLGCLHFRPLDRPLGEELGERAAFIDRTSHGSVSRAEELMITKVLLATRGDDLTRLKGQLEHGADGATLHRLVYRDISDEILRQAILTHFEREAHGADQPSRSHNPRDKVRVLSDIDDTLVRSLCDERYQPKTVIPGVLEFYRALSIGVRARSRAAEQPGEVTFLSARPRELAGLSYSSLLNPLFAANTALITGYSLLPAPRAYPGIGNVHEVQAFAKFRNFVTYAALYPESDFVFIGDSGQGDMLSGELMLYHQPSRMRAVFIHQLVTDGKHGVLCPYPRSVTDLDHGIRKLIFFDTYIGAAVQAYKWGLISIDSLRLIAQATVERLNQHGQAIVSPKHRRLVVTQFRRDLQRAQAVLSCHAGEDQPHRIPELLFGSPPLDVPSPAAVSVSSGDGM